MADSATLWGLSSCARVCLHAPGAHAGHWGICCDALPYGGDKPVQSATCDCNGAPYPGNNNYN